ncbi:MAG: hypothetical protein M3Z26_16195 [Bacteroidota bacterium]|nr:hypothetical protein [Bacteroidota bacterium]
MNSKFTGKCKDMFFWNKICGLGILFFILSNSLYAQFSLNTKIYKITFPAESRAPVPDSIISSASSLFLLNDQFKMPISIPENFSTSKYGFFCRQELMVEKSIKFPLRIRLGSLEQCNYYEGKK